EVRAEVLDDVVDVPRRGMLDVLDRASARPGRVHQRLDLELVGVDELVPLVVEDLDAVVLRRVVGRGDDEPEGLREERDGRGGRAPRRARGPAGLDDPARERLLELRARATGVPPDEDATAARPEGYRSTDALDELGREGVADDAADAVGAEPAPLARL